MALPDQNTEVHPPADLEPLVAEKEASAQFASIAIAELGLNFKPNHNPVQNSDAVDLTNGPSLHQAGHDQVSLFLPIDAKAIRATRYMIWKETGYIPPATGGQDKKESSKNMNWAIFDNDPGLARAMLADILKTEHPHWNEVKIAREVAKAELDRKLERHMYLSQELGEADEQVYNLKEDIKFWRLVLKGL